MDTIIFIVHIKTEKIWFNSLNYELDRPLLYGKNKESKMNWLEKQWQYFLHWDQKPIAFNRWQQ